MKPIRQILFLAALSLSLGNPAQADDLAATPKKPAAKETRRPVAEKPETSAPMAMDETSPGQVVYQVLLAEIALQRGDIELAVQAYADLAKRTRDAKVMERAIEVAGYVRRFDVAADTARLWLETDPASPRAQRLLVSMLILGNRLDEAAPHLTRLLEIDRAALAENLIGLNRMFVRNTDRQAVFRLVEKVCTPFFGLAEAHYAVALAASSAGLNERAKQEAGRALEMRPEWEMAAYLQAQLLLRDRRDEAIAFMEGFLARNPEAREVQLLLARALVGERRYGDAKRHFDQLLKAYPDSPEVVYAVAILALQLDDKTLAEAQLKHFVTLNVQDRNPAYYYLGQIAEENKQFDAAQAYYGQVLSGEHYLPARIRRARLLADQGQIEQARGLLRASAAEKPEDRTQLAIAEAGLLRDAARVQEAFDFLDRQLAEQPEQPELMYETALLAERLNKVELMETRLRRLIEMRPDSPQAYNALGYAFADRNMRLPEARELIEKALSLSPDDGFILDSMGWVLYRLGDLPGALDYLQRSFAKREDPEIAAHLGEVLWMMGRKDEARRLLLDLQKKHPKNEVLAETVRKLNP